MARLARPCAPGGARRQRRRPLEGPIEHRRRVRRPRRRARSRSASSARDLPAGEDEVLRSARADQARQPLRAAPSRDDAEQDLRLAEPGLLAGDAEVARQRQLAAAAERVAGDRRDRGSRDGGHRVQRHAEQLTDQLGLGAGDHLVGCLRRNSEISAPAAKIRSPPVTTTAPGGSSRKPSATAVQLAEHRRRQRVDLGVVEAHDGHTVVAPFEVDETATWPGTLSAGRVEEPFGRRPRIEPAGLHLGRQLLERGAT